MSKTMDIGKNIKILRVSAGLKQKELASNVDVSPSYLSLIEAGKKEPSLSLLKKISDILNVPVGYLLWEAMDQAGDFSSEEHRDLYLKLKGLLLEFQRLRVPHVRPRRSTR